MANNEAIYLSEEQLQRREHQRRQERRRLENLAAVADTPQGVSFLADLLQDLGFALETTAEPESYIRRNVAVRLAKSLGRVRPATLRQILAMIHTPEAI